MTTTLTKKGSVLVSALAACVVIFAAGRLRAQSSVICGPAPDVKAALDKLPSNQTPDQTDYQYQQLRRSTIQVLLEKYPSDVFVQRAYIRSMSYPDEDHDKVMAQYKALHEQHPNDSEVDYLFALTLVGRDSPQAIKLFSSALEKTPNFPWPHLQLVTIYSSPVFLDKEKAAANEKAFLDACPAALEGYDPVARMDDKELLAQAAARLREILQPRTDPEALGAYSTLWSLEFKAHPPSEYNPLRKQVAADLARIRALDQEGERRWWSALEDGYKLTNDQKQSDWARDESIKRFPSPYSVLGSEQWSKDHSRPGDDAPADKRRAYYEALLQRSDELVKERPNTTYFWEDRLDALEHLDDAASADIESCVDKVLQVAEANAGPRPVDSDTYFTVAEVLSKKHLQPERLVEMARKGLDRFEVEDKQPYYDLYATKKNLDESKFYQSSQRVSGIYYEADGYLRLKDKERVEVAISQMDDRLQELKALAGDKDEWRKTYSSQRASYWGAMARLAELEDRKLDAMAYYQSALLERLDSGQLPPSGEKDDLGEGARQLWNSLGGTDSGWKTWYGRRADALAIQAHLTWEDVNEPLPQFELTDLHGKTWQLADLKGKTVFLNFWASW